MSSRTSSNWPRLKKSLREGSEHVITCGSKKITLNYIEKVLWPANNITKGDLINYYISAADYVLPYLKNRPLSLHVKDNGPFENGFYIKGMEGNQPKRAEIFEIERKHKAEGKPDIIDYLVCNDLAALIYIINIGCIDLNPWNSTINSPFHPDYIIIDLDPSTNDFGKVIETALAGNKVLDKLKLKALLKTSGKTGMHIYIPIENRFTFKEARRFASRICEMIHRLVPSITTLEDAVDLRGDKVFLDDSQNDFSDTAASAYSVRPHYFPGVSVPIDWSELTRVIDPSDYTISNVLRRIKNKGDLFSDLFNKKMMKSNAAQLKKIFEYESSKKELKGVW